MAVSFTSPAIAASNLTSKWKEQYGTSAINKKLAGLIPAGIYRGLNLSTSGSNNSVALTADATYQDHLVAYETADGFSVTFHDQANTTYTLDLSDATLLSQTVVVTLWIDYQEGADTQGKFIAYTLSEYNSLSAALKGELIVMGTVVNVAAGNTIPAGNISLSLRSFPWARANDQRVAWKQILKNSSFERCTAPALVANSLLEGWTATSGAQGSWHTSTSDVNTGSRCVELQMSGSGNSGDSELLQYLGVPATAGQRVRVVLHKKAIQGATSGSAKVVAYFALPGGTFSAVTTTFAVNSIDGSYQTVEVYLTAPATTIALVSVGVWMDTVAYSSSGVAIRFDDIAAYMEPQTGQDTDWDSDYGRRALTASSVTMRDLTSQAFSDIAAFLAFNKSLPTTNEGQVELGRMDGDSTANYPALSLQGRMVNLGKSLVSTESDALLPRVSAPVSVAGGSEYTLLWESTPSGAEPTRMYAGVTGRFVITKNLHWNGTQWVKDLTGHDASVARLNADEFSIYHHTAGAADTLADPAVGTGNVIAKRTYDVSVGTAVGVSVARDAFNVLGRFQSYGFHYRDDFVNTIIGGVDPTGLYTVAAGSGGFVDQSSNGHSGVSNAVEVSSGVSGVSRIISMSDLQVMKNMTCAILMRVMFKGSAGEVRLGLVDSPVNNVHIGFYRSDGASNLYVIGNGEYVGSGAGTGEDTGVSIANDTWYSLLVRSTPSVSPVGGGTTQWWINTNEDFNIGTMLASGSKNSLTNIDTSPVGLLPCFRTVPHLGADCTVIVDYYDIWTVSR